MKTTIDISDELLIRAKKYAAENRQALKQVIEQGPLRELQHEPRLSSDGSRGVRWAGKLQVHGPRIFDLLIALDATDKGAVEIWTYDPLIP